MKNLINKINRKHRILGAIIFCIALPLGLMFQNSINLPESNARVDQSEGAIFHIAPDFSRFTYKPTAFNFASPHRYDQGNY